MNFSEELNKYMNLLDCSAKDICSISGLSPTIISRYLKGKRTPRISSVFFTKTVDALYNISSTKNIGLNKKDIFNTLSDSLVSSTINYDVFIDNTNSIISEFKISNVDFSRALGYDTSFISRIRNKKRKPADLDGFVNSVTNYFCKIASDSKAKSNVYKLFNCTSSNLNDIDSCKYLIKKWLVSPHKR